MLKNEMTLDNLPTGNYIPVDTAFFNNPKYASLPVEAFMLHALYSMRMTCSMHNHLKDGGWRTKDGRFYIYFTVKEAADLLRVSERKVNGLRKMLIKANLIEVQQNGIHDYQIFVSNPELPGKEIKPKLACKNTVCFKEKQIAAEQGSDKSPENVDKMLCECSSSRSENLAPEQAPILPTSTKQQDLTRDTKDTGDTFTDTQIFPTEISDSVRIEALKDKYKHILPQSIFSDIALVAKNSYRKTRWFLDTIFKAKKDATNRFVSADLPTEFFDSLTFEGNEYLGKRLGSSVRMALEQMYRYHKVSNMNGFFYTWVRNFFIAQVKQHIGDSYQVDSDLATALNRVSTGRKQPCIA